MQLRVISNNFISEIKRLIKLSYQTYKIHGSRFLASEIIRYIRYGSLDPNHDFTESGEYHLFRYSESEISITLKAFNSNPLFSIITIITPNNIQYLHEFMQMLNRQCYENWELCLCVSNIYHEHLFNVQDKIIDDRHRVNWVFTADNDKWLQLNEGILNASGNYIGFVKITDVLSEYALFENAKFINRYNSPGAIYSDEDSFSGEKKYFNHHFKSDFNLPLLLSHNYISNLLIVKSKTGNDVGWFRQGYDGAEFYDLILRLVQQDVQFMHIPRVLYHNRVLPVDDDCVVSAEKNALQDYIVRTKIKATVIDDLHSGHHRIKYDLLNAGRVSIIIPFKDNVVLLKKCVNSVLENTSYDNYEILLVSNNSEQQDTYEFLNELKELNPSINVYEYNMPFNFSAINNWAVKKATGEYILLLNNDTEVINAGWLESMIEHIQQPNVGVVGAKLLYADNTIQHAGVVVGLSKLAGHAHRFLHNNKPGYFNKPHLTQCVSAVTGACLLTKRNLWDEVGGLDENDFAVAYNDVDYCLKIRKLGYNVIYTPYAMLYHYESKSRGADDTPEKKKRYIFECQNLKKKWNTDSFVDQYYNTNLTQVLEDYRLR